LSATLFLAATLTISQSLASPLDPDLEQVQQLHTAGELQEAIDRVDTYLATHPDSADGHAWRGLALSSLAGEVGGLAAARYGSEARDEFDRALEIDPENAYAHFGIGLSKLFTPRAFGGNVDVAIEMLEQAIEFSPDHEFSSQVLTFLSIAHAKQDRPEEARECLERALILDPANGAAADGLAQLQ